MKQTIYIVLIFIVGQLLGGITVALFGNIFGAEWFANSCRHHDLFLPADLLIIFTLWRLRLAAQRSAWAPRAYWGGRRLWLTLLAMLLLALSQSLLTEPLNLDDLGTQRMFHLMMRDPVCLILLCLVAPLTEEIVFRDGVLRQLVRWGLHPMWAVVVSSLIFALVHGNPQQAVPAFVMGIALGLLFARTGDLRLCLPAHIFNNTMAIALMYIPGSDDWTRDWSLAAHLIPGLLLLAAGTYLICRIVFTTTTTPLPTVDGGTNTPQA